jgi:FkbM family methyltransferase
MKKIFLDFGGNRGQGVRQFVEMYNIDETWEVETYEPNDFCYLENELSDLSFVNVNQKAVWTHTGKVQFNRTVSHKDGRPGNVKNMGVAYIDEGSSVLGLNSGDVKSCVQDIIDVDCIDISEIINRYDSDDYILIKMDVEGAEFELVRKLLKDGTIDKINDLYVEWHPHCVDSESQESMNNLKQELSKTNANVYDWH